MIFVLLLCSLSCVLCQCFSCVLWSWFCVCFACHDFVFVCVRAFVLVSMVLVFRVSGLAMLDALRRLERRHILTIRMPGKAFSSGFQVMGVNRFLAIFLLIDGGDTLLGKNILNRLKQQSRFSR